MSRRVLSTVIVFFSLCIAAFGQPSGRFAYLTDLHISAGAKSVDDLKACIEDINKDTTIQFSIFTGDITDFGSDKEIRLAKGIIETLKKPYYVVAGNHDAKWSESGCNTFASVFGYEHFEFDAFGIKFIGTNSGPNMRMAPALIPRESIVWLDSLIKKVPSYQPVVFVNHYPMDSSVLNWFEVLDILKESDVQMIIGGHWHQNTILEYEGIPGILGRSTMATGQKGPGYNIVTVSSGMISVQEKIVGSDPFGPWFSLKISEPVPFKNRVYVSGPRPDYTCNETYSSVKELWSIRETSDLGTGASFSGDYVVYTTTAGAVKCVSLEAGSEKWSFQTEGKIFSTTAISRGIVVVGSTDNRIYGISIKTGHLLWQHTCDKSVLSSPAIFNDVVYVGASDGRFRALNLKDGKMKWNYPDVKGFVEAKPYVDEYQVVIGDWANTLYSFDTKTGSLQWTWKTKGSRMFSPAAVWPVKSNNRIFIVTPQRITYAIEATSGNTVWSHKGGRESIGLSTSGDRIFVKTMKDTVLCFSTAPTLTPELLWASNAEFGYEIAPTPITTDGELIFVPTDKGDIIALKASDGSYVWKHKLSYALINYIQPIEGRKLLVTTMDGKVSLLTY